MKVIIDIPKKDYDKMCKGELINTILVAIKNGIPIPDDATNGGVLETVFDIEEKEELPDCVGVRFADKRTGTAFKKSWYNAPFKKGVEESEV